MPKMPTSFEMPRVPVSNMQSRSVGNNYEIKFDVQGNMDRSILPEVKTMIEGAIDRAEFKKVKELNKIGQFRPI